VLVLNSQASAQFLAAQPEYVLEAGAEEARIDPENVEILLQHLMCAAFELPFAKSSAGTPRTPSEGVKYAALDAPGTRDALEYQSRQGKL
jgi:DEAD/DEAH box helicase domain-containing protein